MAPSAHSTAPWFLSSAAEISSASLEIPRFRQSGDATAVGIPFISLSGGGNSTGKLNLNNKGVSVRILAENIVSEARFIGVEWGEGEPRGGKLVLKPRPFSGDRVRGGNVKMCFTTRPLLEWGKPGSVMPLGRREGVRSSVERLRGTDVISSIDIEARAVMGRQRLRAGISRSCVTFGSSSDLEPFRVREIFPAAKVGARSTWSLPGQNWDFCGSAVRLIPQEDVFSLQVGRITYIKKALFWAKRGKIGLSRNKSEFGVS